MFDDPETQGRFFYLLILLVAVAGSVLYSARGRIGQTMLQAAVWVMIFILAVIGYGFRDVLTTQLFPRAATVTDAGQIVLGRANGGHFEATLMVNGVPVDFLVDTGASDVVLSLADAVSAGIDTTRLQFTGIAETANGRVRTARARLETLDLGGYVARDIAVSVNEGPMDGSLLGMAYLNRFGRIEITGDRMVLHP
jgi:aspartyl protease family protein